MTSSEPMGMEPPRRVLIVKLSSLGDVVHAMPAVQDLHRSFPHAAIDWVVEPAFAPLVQRCVGVQQVLPCALRQWRRRPFSSEVRAAWAQFRLALQAQHYDAVIDLQGLTKSALVAWLARTTPRGKRYAMAHATDGSSYEAPTRWVADLPLSLPRHLHAVARSRLLCAQALGYAAVGEDDFGLVSRAPSDALARACGLSGADAGRPVVALVHGTSRADKQWPLPLWQALAQWLHSQGFAVVLLHGNAEELQRSLVIASAAEQAVVWPTLALDALCDALGACAGVIGVDSGLSHIAVALGLAHVQIYNFDTAWRTGVQRPHQCCVFASPYPSLESVCAAWQKVWAQRPVRHGVVA